MGGETDDEIASGKYLGNFGRLFVLIWRNGVGKLGFIAYPTWVKSKSSYRQVNIQILWAIYYVQVMF